MKQRISKKIMGYGLAVIISILLSGCGTPAAVSGFNPIYPEAVVGMGENFLNPQPSLKIVTVNSLNPVLKWEQQASHGFSMLDEQFVSLDLTKVQDLRYELLIWNVVSGSRGEIAYNVKNLTENEHKVGDKLSPEKVYFWSVRASFNVDGRRRITEWTIADWPCIPGLRGKNLLQGNVCGREFARSTGRIHPLHYLRFKTPSSSSNPSSS